MGELLGGGSDVGICVSGVWVVFGSFWVWQVYE